jgi:glycosyltransferase involved in cell wall biosynthesis
MLTDMQLSIVIPALNEEKTIGIVVGKAFNSIKRIGITAEVIVVDNGSADKTLSVAAKLGARVVPSPLKGYGSALQAGFRAAQGEYILMADADDSYDLEAIKPFLDKLNEGSEFVIGNRYQGQKIKGAMPFLHRYLGTPVLTLIMNLMFQTKMGDINCGMRAFRKNTYQRMNCTATGMEFASEMLIKTSLLNIKIAEIPCTLYPDKRNRPPHLKKWSDGWRHLRLIFLLKFLPSIDKQ